MDLFILKFMINAMALILILYFFPFLEVYSQLIRFARVCNHNARNKCLRAKLFQHGYRYHTLRKTFSEFYRRHFELISKVNVGLKRYPNAMVRKMRNQKEIPIPKTEAGKIQN